MTEGAILKWADRVQVARTAEPYYDVTTYRVPVTAPVVDSAGAEAIRKALYARWRTSLTGWSVGGYTTPRVRPTEDPLIVEVDTVYHIGD